jgi:hypothetical protein
MALAINDTAPISGGTADGRFHIDLNINWAVLFSHPKDLRRMHH